MSDIAALFAGQELSEEFKTKATAIIEEAIKVGVDEQVKTLTESLTTQHDEKVEAKMVELKEANEKYIEEEVLPNVDRYLSEAVTQWSTDNKVAIEEQSKVALADSFLTGLVGLAESHRVKLPEGKDALVESQKALDEANKKVLELTESVIDLRKAVAVGKRKELIEAETAKLSENQKSKIISVTENVEYKNDEQFSAAVKSLVESYFPTQQQEQPNQNNNDGTNQQEPINESYADQLLKALKAGKKA